MKELECPKCGFNNIPPIFHKSSKECKKGKRDLRNKGEGEHLHYICICTYDFVDSVLEKE